jgi:flagellin
MAINDITLTTGMRANLLNLQQTANLLNKTQGRLATGKKVNSALDNPVAYFASRAHLSRANDITSLKEGMGEAVQTIKAADNGISSITDLIESAKALSQAAKGAAKNQIKVQFTSISATNTVTVGGTLYTAVATTGAITSPTTQFVADSNDIETTLSNLAALINAQAEGTDMVATATGTTLVLEAKSSNTAITQGNYTSFYDKSGAQATVLTDTDGYSVFSERRALSEQYNSLMHQIDAVANSSGYKGVNLLMNEDLNVSFENSAISVKGFSATASDLSLSSTATDTTSGQNWAWSVNTEISTDLGKLETAIPLLRSEASKLANNLSIIQIQDNFTAKLVTTLTEGADKLTLADMNEEGANMLMLQTRQSLSTTALSLSSQAAQSVLRLFG